MAAGLAIHVVGDQTNVLQRNTVTEEGVTGRYQTSVPLDAIDAAAQDLESALRVHSPTTTTTTTTATGTGLASQSLRTTSPTTLLSMDWRHLAQERLFEVHVLEGRLAETETQLRVQQQQTKVLTARVQELSEENRQLQSVADASDSACIVCCERPKKVVYGCQHFLLCEKCDEVLKKSHGDCPVCRKPIELRISII